MEFCAMTLKLQMCWLKTVKSVGNKIINDLFLIIYMVQWC